jgi:rhamnulokinase
VDFFGANLKASRHFIGVDLGGESGRVVQGSFDGQKLQLQEAYRFATGGEDFQSTLRWDVHRIWSEIQQGLAVAAKTANEFVSVGVDSWGVDYALLNADEELIELPFHYRDLRNVGMLDTVLSQVPKSEIFSRTGIQFMEINTLYQLVAQQAAGDSLQNAHHLLTIADYFHWCLCGAKSIEFTMATTTQCFDPASRSWAKELLGRLDVPTQMLPDVVEPGTVLGKIRTDVAEVTGLQNVSVVTPATHDTASAVVAVPVSESVGKNWAYISSGTWSLVGTEVDTPVISEAALDANVTNEGGVDGTWRLLKNVMGLWLIQRLKLAFAERGFDRSYGELTKMAGATLSSSCFIDPDDASFLNPANMEQAILNFLDRTNQAAPSDEAGLVRCVLESLALRYCQVIREIESLTGSEVSVIHVVGGGCQNILLNQFIAGATQLPVLAGPSEATAIGNIMVQCKASGDLNSLADIRKVVRDSVELIHFEPMALTYWQDAMAKFEGVCGRDASQNVAESGQ